jgi:biotin carboxyl carrier protein
LAVDARIHATSSSRILPGLAGQDDRVHHPETAAEGRPMAIEIEAQIAGNVWKIEKAVGERVVLEEVILIIESMKMEIPVEAPRAGLIREIRVAEGDSIE